jgi:diguanylate cyclase (GGDEF)-like protein
LVHGWSFGLGLSTAGAIAGGAAVYLVRRKGQAAGRARRKLLDYDHEHFRAAVEGSLDAFYILDSVRNEDGRIVDFSFRYLNPVVEQRLQCDRAHLIGKSYRQSLACILNDEQFARYCEVVTTGIPLHIELPVDKPHFSITRLQHKVVKLGDGIAITSTDISHIKQARDDFQSAVEFGGMIFDNAPFSIIATDAAGIITAMNFEAEVMTGYSSSELVNVAPLTLLHDREELRQRAVKLQEEQEIVVGDIDLIAGSFARPGGRPRKKLQEEVCTFVCRDGTRIAVSLAVRVLTGHSGERTGLIAIAYDVNKRKQAIGATAHGANHDSLTGLIGKSLLEDRIDQAIRRSKRAVTKVAVFTIDLDHFKRINDQLGHPIGDEILTIAAGRLVNKVRSADTVARIGGDEFIVVIADQLKVSDAEFCAGQLLRAISEPYTVKGHVINLTASVGICLHPDFAGDVENLLKRSEAAVYAAKEMGRNRIALFASHMLADAHSRISMEGALRQALDRDELFIEYQPQVALPGGEVIGMEALLRWRHPRFGLVSPAHFIPMAEQLGLLSEFGIWAMRRACREAKWIQNQLGRSVSLSVNLSPNQFQQARLLRTIADSLNESGLAPECLEIEIIENTLMINSTANLETLQMIRDLGVRLSIDDFGTGFCNFNYLLQYQVDRLKIDQSFVRQAASDANAASVVRTVIAMSHQLGIKVIAEGVETQEQLKFLTRRRCDQAQGYFFAKPLSPEEFVRAVPGIEGMNLSDASGEHAGAHPAVEEQPAALTASGASRIRTLALT